MFVYQQAVFALAAGLLGATAPLGALKAMQGQRLKRFEMQLPDALSLVSSSLRSGYSFSQALQTVAQEMKPPVALEMQKILDEVKAGIPIEEALDRLVPRIKTYDVELMVSAVSIQHQVGGNLADLLDTVAETIRERFRTRGEIAGLTAEGRLSGIILFFAPLGMLLVLMVLSPDYIQHLFNDQLGRAMLGGAILMQIIGGLIIRRMLSIDA
jgi:tight adherence protein B